MAALFVAVVIFIFGFIQAKQPHIVLVLADDLGFSDVGYNNVDMLTPNLDKLAASGVKLSQAYVQPVCSPSRSALMTGLYPHHTGLQHSVILGEQNVGLPLNLTTLPEKLKRLGYATRMVGKWHLGFCNWSYTPTNRGFDSFVGYYKGMEDYYNHTSSSSSGTTGTDFRFNESVYGDKFGQYSTHVFGQHAVDVINSHCRREPLFLYLAFQAVHFPLEVPEKYENMYKNIKNEPRRMFSGMVTAMDEAIGNVTRALEDRGMLNDTVIFFTTDNGGNVLYAGNNYPLRGSKACLWEGGTRGVAFASGSKVKGGEDYKGLFHAVDWYPTIIRAAGGQPDPSLDGIDQWENIRKNIGPYPRREMVYNIDSMAVNGALRIGDYKLIVGDACPVDLNGRYPVPTSKDGTGLPQSTETYMDTMADLERKDELRLDSLNVKKSFLDRDSLQKRLFNIRNDPSESVDLAKDRPDIVEQMFARFLEIQATEVTPMFPPPTEAADPKYWQGSWSPGWC